MRHSIETYRLKAWQIMLLLLVLQIIFAFFTNNFTLSFDESIWQYIGRNWFRNGLVPYSGGVDNKSPLIFMIYGISDRLFGVNYWFPRLLAIAFQTTGIWFIYKLVKHLYSSNTALLAIIFYGFSLLWKSSNGKMVSLTQTYEITFLIISFYFLLKKGRRHLLFAGILAGAAIMFRFSAATVVLLMIASLIYKRSFSGILQFVIGLVIVSGCILILYSLAGIHLDDFLNNSLKDNFSSGGVSDHPIAWKLEQFANAFFYSELVLFYPFVIAYLLFQKKIDIFSGWLIAAFISTAVIGMFAQAHMKELLPALSIMSAVAMVRLSTDYKIPLRAIFVIIAIAFFPKDLEPLMGIKKSILLRDIIDGSCKEPFVENEEWNRKLGEWIKDNTQPNETVYVAGYGAQVQAYACRLSPTVYFNVTQTPVAKQQLFNDLAHRSPDMIAVPMFAKYNLVSADIRNFTAALITKDYYLDRCLFSYNIYRKKK